MKFDCEIIDRCEGTIHYETDADSEEEAEEFASIHASELGCRFIDEIICIERLDEPE